MLERGDSMKNRVLLLIAFCLIVVIGAGIIYLILNLQRDSEQQNEPEPQPPQPEPEVTFYNGRLYRKRARGFLTPSPYLQRKTSFWDLWLEN
jgi:hypothetical protein